MSGGKKLFPAEYRARFNNLAEIDLIAHMISSHETLGVGPGRAEKVLLEYQTQRQKVANTIAQEIKEDEQGEFCKTQRDLAKLLKSIFGPANWEKYKFQFPMLKDYWNLV